MSGWGGVERLVVTSCWRVRQDLMGYIVIENALSPEELARLTAEIDRAEAEEGGLPEYPRCEPPDPTMLGLAG